MSGEWMQIDFDLPDKPEVLRIMELTGDPIEVVFFRLFLFWRWVEKHCVDGRIPGATCPQLVRITSGDERFVSALTDPHVNWLQLDGDGLAIPGFEKRFSKSAKRRITENRRKSESRS